MLMVLRPAVAPTPHLGITANTAAARRVQARPAAGDDAAKRLRWQLQRGAQGLLREERVAKCQRGVSGDFVHIRCGEHGAHFKGLMTCGSVWHCPICAAKISEGRREELQAAITTWSAQGGAVYLVSYTFRHDRTMLLRDTLPLFTEALRKLKATRAYKRLLESAGSAGTVRALEVTHGANGWHPHTHELIFAAPGMLETLQEIRAVWARIVRQVGLGSINEHGFDVRGGDYAAEYVAKFGHEPATEDTWGAARELTKGHTKQGLRLTGRSPFALLRAYCEGDNQAGALFAEYAAEFRGRRQLFWSPKLRQALALAEEASDQDLAEREELQPAEYVCSLTLADWNVVIRTNARYAVLQAAEVGGAEAVRALVDSLKGRRSTHSGLFQVRRHFGPGEWTYDA